MVQKLLFLFFLISAGVSAQIVGKVTDSNGNPLGFVNIYLQSSYLGTASNEDGNYSLAISKSKEKPEYQISFKVLGYKTFTQKISPTAFPYTLDVVLQEETTSLEEVVLNRNEDPAYRIVRKTIGQQKENLKKLSEFTADFYSRGMLKMKNVPQKILWQKVGDFDGALDSTRTGSVYLSETISEIAFQQPNKYSEKIIASNEIGDDNGFGFNNAESVNYSFYENTNSFRVALVSPLAKNAFNFYDYKLDGVFQEGSKRIYKIRVIPLRPKDRVWQGYIYIVEDDWQLYGVDLSTTGSAIQISFFDTLNIKQNYKFDEKEDCWVKIFQTIDFNFGLLGMEGEGNVLGVYSNYNFNPEFSKKSFTNEVISFSPRAKEKNSIFWKVTRPVPLSNQELSDYLRRDSIQDLRETKPYLDSLDAIDNKVSIFSPFTGYTYTNSYDKWSFDYEGLLPVINFNTVQGWNEQVALTFAKWYDPKRTNTLTATLVGDYGISEDRLRVYGSLIRVLNQVNKRTFGIGGGSKITQFNDSKPISPFKNTVTTLLFENNHMKVYELNFVQVGYGEEVFNGLHLYGNLSFENRQPLYNTTDYVFIKSKTQSYTSNNPLDRTDFNTAAIEEHNMIKGKFRAKINIAQKYFSNPNVRYSVDDDDFPEINFVLTTGSSPNNSKYDFTQLEGRIGQSVTVGNKGKFSYLFKGGGFTNGKNISFVDYKHFNGDETWLGTTSTYINIFNLMNNYEFSTSKEYFEAHFEHNFQGWILGRIPGINQLNLNLVVGAHYLSTQEKKPYSEFSIGLDNLGIGKLRMLRLDYVRSFYNGRSDQEVVVGVKFLNILGI